MSEKTEQPTHTRVKQARKDGQVAKSKDLTQALTSLVWTGLASVFFETLFMLFRDVLISVFDQLNDRIVSAVMSDGEWMPHIVFLIGLPAAILTIAIAMIGIAGAVIAEQLQVKGVLSGKPLGPDVTKLNPVKQIKAIFSIKTIVELIKNLVKISGILLITLLVCQSYFSDIVRLADVRAVDGLIVVARLLFYISLYSQLFLLMMSVVDVMWQKYQHIKGMKMSKDEVRRDYRQQEGSPEMKGARRQLHAAVASE